MIYWGDVRKTLSKHCPTNEWKLEEIIFYLNKVEGLSMAAIAKLTEGKCGRTSLVLKMKKLNVK